MGSGNTAKTSHFHRGTTAHRGGAGGIGRQGIEFLEKELSLHESAEERQILLNIRQALDRIREGTFGECLGCGSEINSKRLEAVPWTQYCIDCQRSLER